MPCEIKFSRCLATKNATLKTIGGQMLKPSESVWDRLGAKFNVRKTELRVGWTRLNSRPDLSNSDLCDKSRRDKLPSSRQL